MYKLNWMGFLGLLLFFSFSACQDESVVKEVEEGLPCSVKFSVSIPENEQIHMTRATDEQETKVEKLALLFFKATQPGEPPVVEEITSLGSPTQISSTHYTYQVTIQSDYLTSGQWFLYAIANYDKQFSRVTLQELKTMTKAEIDAYCTSGSSKEIDIVESAVLMSGKYQGEDPASGQLTLNPGENTLSGNPSIVLTRTIAKSTFTFLNGTGVNFVPTRFSVFNASSSATLLERSGWGVGQQIGHPGNLQYSGNNGFSNIENQPIQKGSSTFSFYTQENVQQAASVPSGFKYHMREERVSDNDRTFKYAPANATYVVVKGIYTGPGRPEAQGEQADQVTGEVEYTIHLGAFTPVNGGSVDNFSVRRNVKYNYTVTVNGVNSIIAEAQAETDGGIQHGAEGHIINRNQETSVRLDAHYEQVLMKIPHEAPLSEYSLTVKTPFTNKVFKKSSDATTPFEQTDDIRWIEFGKPASTSTFQAYGDLKKANALCSIKELLDELAAFKPNSNPQPNSTHFLYDANTKSVYVTAYVNEFYYDDKIDQLTQFINVDDREMTLGEETFVSSDGHSSYTKAPIFSIKQRSIQSPMNLSMPNPFGLETVEEEGETGQVALTKDNSDPQYNQTPSVTTNDFGWQNYKQLFPANSRWDTYVDHAKNGYVPVSQSNGEVVVQRPENVMQQNYEYALYRVLSRNRDNNGNGTIDDDELRWYLPSHYQCLTIWYGNNSLPAETQIHVSSRSYKTYITSSANNSNRTWWADEGVAFGRWKNDRGDENKNAIRAVRNLKQVTQKESKVSTYDAATRIVTIDGLADNCLRLDKISGNYVAHGTGADADRLPKRFQIAGTHLDNITREDAATSPTIGQDYSEETGDAGQWRVPNEKELALILAYINPPAFTIARTTYDGSRYYYVSMYENFISTSHEHHNNANTWKVYLVRDVQ